MVVILNLALETERKLRERAAQSGVLLEEYIQQLLVRNANGESTGEATSTSGQVTSLDEFDRILDELSEGAALPHLPAHFSRADIYHDHD